VAGLLDALPGIGRPKRKAIMITARKKTVFFRNIDETDQGKRHQRFRYWRKSGRLITVGEKSVFVTVYLSGAWIAGFCWHETQPVPSGCGIVTAACRLFLSSASHKKLLITGALMLLAAAGGLSGIKDQFRLSTQIPCNITYDTTCNRLKGPQPGAGRPGQKHAPLTFLGIEMKDRRRLAKIR